MSLTASAHVVTDTPARYISRLCKHFAHRIPVSFDEHQGRIEFDFGIGLLHAEAGGLTLKVEAADTANLEKMKDVIASHFERFAWQEALQLDWR
ncbi:hypothetical protein PSm6_13270 [Pseudomonas solani]|uniref:DUF2218 domain-containing protein n=1 Tax=Pseudomonas solani TaxID=2731552 RepID=A0AAU7Y0Q3_9PSED|nr:MULTISPECIES: DUF2218 domain-containing protein [Pseudomonas]EQM69115.1 hypothetical protein L682_15440 [Pseudomonas alcaligenes OT 69]MDN4149197.1 DUF2218 domain-containing protein [Pseudomonas tohonis]MDU9411903.1 DUF2218 domain-containing protein [Pseudomonas sp. zfem005]WCD79763.1 DUF2218 domain-containing protein [Pseudomonas sp. TUM22785]BCD84920.1 hypothetical protein PSm6_13270 [Pseudomonas solani]